MATEEEFRENAAANTAIPSNIAELREQLHHYFGRDGDGLREGPAVAQGDGTHYCGTTALGLVRAGLANPALTEAERSEIEQFLKAREEPTLEAFVLTDYCAIDYTRVGDLAVTTEWVLKVRTFLETAYLGYRHMFGIPPLASPCPSDRPRMKRWTGEKVWVQFSKLPRDSSGQQPMGIALTDGPIVLHTPGLLGNEALAQTVSAHEMFHRLQFAFGLREDHLGRWMWFQEGMACWAELFATDGNITWERAVSYYFGDCTRVSRGSDTTPPAFGYFCALTWLFAELHYDRGTEQQRGVELRGILQRFRDMPDTDKDANRCYDGFFTSVRRLDFAASLAFKDAWRSEGKTVAAKVANLPRKYATITATDKPLLLAPILAAYTYDDLTRTPTYARAADLVAGAFAFVKVRVEGLSSSETPTLAAHFDRRPRSDGSPGPLISVCQIAVGANSEVLDYQIFTDQPSIDFSSTIGAAWSDVVYIAQTEIHQKAIITWTVSADLFEDDVASGEAISAV